MTTPKAETSAATEVLYQRSVGKRAELVREDLQRGSRQQEREGRHGAGVGGYTPWVPRTVLIYAYCPGVIVSSILFHSQKHSSLMMKYMVLLPGIEQVFQGDASG